MSVHQSGSYRRRQRASSRRGPNRRGDVRHRSSRHAELHRRGRRRRGSGRLPVLDETSAGGLIVKVENRRAYVALIARRNRNGQLEWCLPKGHLEYQETAPEAARREIFEETGISGRVIVPLTTIDYWFDGSGRRIHKKVHHFLLEATGGQIGVENDPDQEAENAAWMPLEEVADILVYPNERRVVAIAMDLLQIGE